MPDGSDAQCEVLAKGQQVVAYGIHPDTRRNYEWLKRAPLDFPIHELPIVTEAKLQEYVAAVEQLIRRAGGLTKKELAAQCNADTSSRPKSDRPFVYSPPTFAEVADALSWIPNDHDWNGWVKIGAAIFHALGSGGKTLFADWSAQSSRNDVAETDTKWRSFITSLMKQVTAASLFWEAGQRGWKRGQSRGAANDSKQGASDPNWRFWKGESEEEEDLLCVQLPKLGNANIPPRQWVYGNFLLVGYCSAFGAVDGGGKGAMAVAMALSIITGRHLLGEKIWRTEPVAIISSYEDSQEEWHRRIAAACEYHRVDYDKAIDHIYFIEHPTERICFARPGNEKETAYPHGDMIIRKLKTIGAVMLIIDPFNHSHSFEDGNNNIAIAKAAGEMARVAAQANVATLVLHHLRKGLTT